MTTEECQVGKTDLNISELNAILGDNLHISTSFCMQLTLASM
jgi:hypothetical protein